MRGASVLAGLSVALAACGGGGAYRDANVNTASGTVKIGKPYQIRGRWYRPEDDHDYRETGTASWYGPNFHGKPTANGERFDQNALTAAHRTLPMPSWVTVENLDNGREVMVRVNDRGPFAHNRIIDVSRRAAQLLGMEGAGVARVRVTRVYPDDTEPAPVYVARTDGGSIYVQVAAVSQRERGRELAASLGRYGPSALATAPNGLTRVRLGPFGSVAQAQSVLERVRRGGYPDARIVSDPQS